MFQKVVRSQLRNFVSELHPVAICKIPFTFDSIVVFSVIGKLTPLLEIIGLFKSVKSNTTFPFDSFEFKIPSLSKI